LQRPPFATVTGTTPDTKVWSAGLPIQPPVVARASSTFTLTVRDALPYETLALNCSTYDPATLNVA